MCVVVDVAQYALQRKLMTVIVCVELKDLIEKALIKILILLQFLSYRVDFKLQLHKVKSPEIAY